MRKITLFFFLSLLSFCANAQVGLPKEGFETGWTLAPTGAAGTNWFTMQNDVSTAITWVQGLPNSPLAQPAYEGERAAFLARQNVIDGTPWPEDYLVTPEIEVPQSPEIHFYSRLTLPEDNGSIYKIFIINLTATPDADINSPASYTEIKSWTELEINPSQLEYTLKVVPIPAEYIGARVRIAFMMTGDDMDRWLIDNVEVIKKCERPTTLEATNLKMHSADLTWANPSGATKWEIELISDAENPTGTPTFTYEGTLPFNVSNLDEDTCYKFYVRAVCQDGAKSDWVGATLFCTERLGDNCADPIVVNLPYTHSEDTTNFADNYKGNAGTNCNTNEWEDYLRGNDVVYKYTATFTGEINIDLTNTDSNAGVFIYGSCADIGVNCLGGANSGDNGVDVSIDGFEVTNGEDYYFVISTAFNPSSPYTITIQAVACDEPGDLSAAEIGMTSAELSWTNPTDADSWEVVVQAAGIGVPQGTGETVTDNTDYLWDNLQASTAYEYWVRADCNNGAFSAWAGPYYFNTMICEVVDQCTFTFNMWGEWGSWENYTMLVKQNGITIATLTGPVDGEPTEVQVPVCNTYPLQLFWRNDGSPWGASAVGVSVKNSFGQEIYVKNPGQGTPNTTLYEVEVDCEKPYCLAPKGLTASNATQTTVDLSWEGPATGNWDYYIVEEGGAAPDDATIGTPTETNPTIGAGGLEEAKNYEYYVRMRCEDASTELSPWSKAGKFSSSVCDPAEKCDYEFILGSQYWDGGWDGGYMTIRQNNTNVAIIGPSFGSGETTETVIVPLCHEVPFEIFWNSVGNGWSGGISLSVVNKFDQTVFELPFESGSEFVSTVIYEGEVNCQFPACLQPKGLTASNGTMTSIDLAWEGPATGTWEYYIVEAGGAAPTDATIGTSTTTNPVTAPLANPATNYEYYVRVICTDSSAPTSPWAGPYAMHSEVCNESEKCTFFFELQSKNGWNFSSNTMSVYQGGVPAAVLGPDFNWDSESPYSQMFEVKLCPGVEIEIVWDEVGYDENDKGLHVYSPYMEDVYVKPFGEGNQGDTLFTGLVSCDPPPCPKPQNLTASEIGLNQATLNWDEMGDATSWEVWVLPVGSPAPTTPGESVDAHPKLWEDLTPGTPYVFYVRANCGDADGFSTWSGPFTFVTLIGNDDCEEPMTVPVNAGVECLEFVGGTITGSTGSGIMPTCAWMEPEYDVWFEFTATEANHVLNIYDQLYFDALYAVYESGDCGNLTEVTCGQDAGVITGLVPGNKYLIQVYSNYIPYPALITSFRVCVSTPKSVVVDDTIAPEDIVMNSLIKSSCANIQNITWKTGTDIGVNGIAYFEKGLSSFPLEEGILLMTGDAKKAPGPNLGGAIGDGPWEGDQQLLDYMNDLGLDPGSYNDATVLEFDFTPLANKLKFPFVFASEEYGEYQCQFSDAFAFFLTTDDGTGPVTINLAVVPETNSPVSVVTIRDGAFNSDCESVNEPYFDRYFGDYFLADMTQATDPLLAPVNFEGNTIKMFAEADVVPNQVYHIKLVIADRGDSSYDSAIFVGKFDIGNVDLGADLTIADGSGLCSDATYTIVSGMDPDDYTFTWSKDDEVIAGETGADLVVTESGTYTVVADFGGTCSTTDSVKVEFYPDVEMNTGNPTQLTICDADGFGTFNLSDNTAIIVATDPAEYTVSYHLTEAQALTNEDALPLTNYENATQFEQIIYVRITNKKGCVAVKTFSLVVQDLTPIFKVNDDFAICEGTTGTITVTPVEPANYDPANVTYSWTYNGNALTDTTSSITVTAPGIYEATVNNGGCPGTDAVTMSITPTPVADKPANVTECVEYVLPALSANNNYYTGTGGTGTMLSAGEKITSTQNIYVFAFSSETPECTAENVFTVTIVPTPIVAIVESCEDNNYVLEVIFDGDEIYNVDNVTFAWVNAAGAALGSDSKLIVTTPDTYFVTVTPKNIDKVCPSTGKVEIDNTTCMIPRGISPNGDGKNDNFDLSTLDVKHLSVFNRYGKEVYTKDSYTKQFFGQGTHGDDLPTGTYYYMIERANGETLTGWLYINRDEK